MRTTTTNSGAESKGVVRFGRWELEGESYLLLVVGAVCGVVVFIAGHRLPFSARAVLALVPLVAAVVWIRLCVCGRPPHFVGDRLEGLLAGTDFKVRPGPGGRQGHPCGGVVE